MNNNDKHELWVEKARPQKLSEVIGLPQNFEQLVNENIPHLLFIGPSGTGKSTVSQIIINMLKAQSLNLNASDERGIDTVREKVKAFASTKVLSGKIKCVYMDEFDGMLFQSQFVLRNLMEKYSGHCRFILTANYSNKIIPAIKSRCSVIEFTTPNKAQIKNRLKDILFAEEVKYNEQDLGLLINDCYPDMRKMINTLQAQSTNGTFIYTKTQDLAKEIWQLILDRKFPMLHEKIIKENVDIASLLPSLSELIMQRAKEEKLTKAQTKKLLLLLGELNLQLYEGPFAHIAFDSFAIKAMEGLNQ